jgi:protein-tyrosine-phosphatase
MAEGLAKHLYPNHIVMSAGVEPEISVSLFAVRIMADMGIDISGHVPVSLQMIVNEHFDRIVCFGKRAYQACLKAFPETDVRHFDVEDPWGTTGDEQRILSVYLHTRQQLEIIVSEICSK